MAKVNGLFQDLEELEVRVAYQNYLASTDNPLKSFEDFAEDYCSKKTRTGELYDNAYEF